jgi:phosphomannomutase
MSIFKAYDIRGIYAQEIDAELSFDIGRAVVRCTGGSSFVVGRDARIHSEELYGALIEGFRSEGKNVLGIGLCSTPQLHHTQQSRRFDVGIMTTASHNPPQYHGFKLYDRSGGSISYGTGLETVERLVNGSIGPSPARVSKGEYTEEDTLEAYVAFIRDMALGEGRDGKPFRSKFVVDASNGSAGRVFSRLFDELSLDGILINGEPDGMFPVHSPNPLKPESRSQASGVVLQRGCDFGAVLDGDGDRILYIDEKGESVGNSLMAALLAEELLLRSPAAAVVHDLISSRILPERIRALGGRPVISRVGYTHLYEAMVREEAVFGSEASGHGYIRVDDTYYTESTAFALIVLLKLLQRKRSSLSSLVQPWRNRYYQAPETNLEVEDKEGAMARVRRASAGGRISSLDGLSVEYDDYWFNLRPSNTEPVLRLRLEGFDEETCRMRLKTLVRLITDKESP